MDARLGLLAVVAHARTKLADSVVRGFVLALALHVIGQGASFGLQIVYARITGTAEYGVLSIVFAWVGVLLIGGKAGFDMTLLRFLPLYKSVGEWGYFRGLLSIGRYLPVAVAFVVAVVATGVLARMPTVWESSLGSTSLLAAWFLPFAVYLELTAASLRALQCVWQAIVGETISRPVLACMIVVGLYGLQRESGGVTSFGAMGTYVIATFISAGIVSFWLRCAMPSAHSTVAPILDLRRWLGVSTPLMIASAFQALLYSVDVIMLGMISTPTNSGVYSAASKLSMIALFAMNAVQLSAGPLISAAIANKDRVGLSIVVHTAIRTSLSIAVPIVVVMVLFRKTLLSMFGAEFEVGGIALTILALTQLFNTATGPVGLILSMAGQQYWLMGCLGFGLVINVGLNLLLIPSYGFVGAASSAAVAHGCWNIAAVVAVVKCVDINPTVFTLRWATKGST